MYKKFPTGGVLKYQIFSAEANNNSKLCKVLCRLSALPDAEENAVVMRKGCSDSTKNPNDFLTIDGEKILRSNYIKTGKPEPFYDTAPGLKPREKVGLFTQWRPFFPDEETANETCPMPTDAEFSQVKKDVKETLMCQNAAIAKKKSKLPEPCTMTSNKRKSMNKAEKGKEKKKQKKIN